MIEWTEEKLKENGYKIENAEIIGVNFQFVQGTFNVEIIICGDDFTTFIESKPLGYYNPDFDKCISSITGIEYIMKLMHTIDCDVISASMEYRYENIPIRVAYKGYYIDPDDNIIIGNNKNDKWFDSDSFFTDKIKEKKENVSRELINIDASLLKSTQIDIEDENETIRKHIENVYITNAKYNGREKTKCNQLFYIVKCSYSSTKGIEDGNYYVAIYTLIGYIVIYEDEGVLKYLLCKQEDIHFLYSDYWGLALIENNDAKHCYKTSFKFAERIIYEDKYCIDYLSKSYNKPDEYKLTEPTYTGMYSIPEQCGDCGNKKFKIEVMYSTLLQAFAICESCGRKTPLRKNRKTKIQYNSNGCHKKENEKIIKYSYSKCPICNGNNFSTQIYLDVGQAYQTCDDCGWRSQGLKNLIKENTRKDSINMREWRCAVLKRDGYKCVKCGSQKELQTHHIIHVADDPEGKHIFEVDNGITLCKECHMKEHGKNIKQIGT